MNTDLLLAGLCALAALGLALAVAVGIAWENRRRDEGDGQ